jgi:hypothetical protein
VFSRYSIGTPTPPPGAQGSSASSRTISVSDKDTEKLDQKGSGVGRTDEEIGLAPLDDEDVLGVAHRKSAKKTPTDSDKAASTSDLATSSDVAKEGGKTGSGSQTRSLIEEELHDPELEQIRRKVAQRAQFNPLQPPGYVPPSSGPSWMVWLAIGGAAAVLLILVLLVVLSG